MVYAIRAVVRAVRRSPNAYAVIIGTAILVLAPAYLVAVVNGANSDAPAPIAAIQRIIAETMDTMGLGVIIFATCPALALILMGATRLLTPHDDRQT